MARRETTDPAEGDPENSPGNVRQIDSRALFGESRILQIRHAGELYTLRITRTEKLILTK